tara:strand:- start:868 stop:1179 length:312 start_codon:yes stop_codon:yes gene_type:complete
MIKISESPLETEKEKDFRLWLSKGPYVTLVKLIESKVAFHQVKAINASVIKKDIPDNTEQGSLKIQQMEEGHLKQAQRYQVFLEILNEIREQDDPFTLTRMSC